MLIQVKHLTDAITPAGRQAYQAIQATAETTRAAIDEVIAFRTEGQLAAARLVLFEDTAPGFTQWLNDINVFIDLQESLNATETAVTRDLTGSFV